MKHYDNDKEGTFIVWFIAALMATLFMLIAEA